MKNKMSSRAWILLGVEDFARSRNFYETVLEQELDEVIDGDHLSYKSGVALQRDYKGIVEGSGDFAATPTGAKLEVKTKANNYQLAFEVDDIDYWQAKIKASGAELIHDVHEYVWGQRVIRFYDPDGHIIELGEDLEVVAKRFLVQGLTAQEVSKRFGFSLEYVQQLLDTK
ncbi:MAG: glyoxalase/bleomycin resistance/dioxygenase family protein [Oscillospiraceae bacterium]|nr:glyoxalase/bleomycin resistance/dioxygenase family protein [Oscillospiraceae bacterium]